MQTVTHVLFNREERNVLARAVNAATIAYSDDTDTLRLLNGICGKGEAISRRRLNHALDAMEKLLAIVDEEGTEDYWLAQLQWPTPTEHDRGMARVLAEARRMQAAHIREALPVVNEARLHATEVDDYDAELIAT